MSKTESGWDWFQPPPVPDQSLRLAIARSFARAFSGPDGDLALTHLRALTMDRCLGPDCGDAALRSLEGQRLLVHHILSLIETGRDASLHI